LEEAILARSTPLIDLPTWWEALSSVSSETAGGKDQNVYEMYKALPTSIQLTIVKLLNQRLVGEVANPGSDEETWKILLLLGLAKERGACELATFRWIAKTAVLQKLYLKCVLKLVDRTLVRDPYEEPNTTRTLGFSPGGRCQHITEYIRELANYLDTWGGGAIVAQGDIRFAFDSMSHARMEEALKHIGGSKSLCAALMREYRELTLQAEVGDSGHTEPVEFERGGRQGGVEPPRLFNYVVKYMWDHLIRRWHLDQVGVVTGFAGHDEKQGFSEEVVHHHDVWADNAYFYAKDQAQMTDMLQDITRELYRFGFSWKIGSLKQMGMGKWRGKTASWTISLPWPSLIPREGEDSSQDESWSWLIPKPEEEADEIKCDVKEVSSMEVLGVLLNNQGLTSDSIVHRLAAASRAMYKHKDIFFAREVNWATKVQAWCRSVQRCALHGAGGWHLSKANLRALLAWERQQLRNVLRLRWKPHEGRHAYLLRSARIIDQIFRDQGKTRLPEAALEETFRWANHLVMEPDWRNRSLRQLLFGRSRHWWETNADSLCRLDPGNEGSWRHRKPGKRTAWESMFCEVFGTGWSADWPTTSEGLTQHGQEFIRGVCERFHLGLWPTPKGNGESALAKKERPIDINPSHPVWQHRDYHQGVQRERATEAFPCKHFTDARVVAGWMQGQSAVFNRERRQDVRELGLDLEQLVQKGAVETITPASWWAQWIPREYNKGADWLCNVRMALQRNIYFYNSQWHPDSSTCIFSFSDGGVRKTEQKSSAATVIVDVGQERTVVACIGAYLPYCTPVQAELYGIYIYIYLTFILYNALPNGLPNSIALKLGQAGGVEMPTGFKQRMVEYIQ